jgi:hypothetical protein
VRFIGGRSLRLFQAQRGPSHHTFPLVSNDKQLYT